MDDDEGAVGFGFQWHLTDRCNLRCAHCYQERFDRASERSLDELRLVADAIFRSLPGREVSINLTGGEPLLLPGLFALLAHLEAFPALKELNLITNGTHAGDEVIERLRGLERLGCLKVSLEAADRAINDAIRGEGTLARVEANVARFIEAGLPVVLMMTLSARNLGAIGETARWARGLGCTGLIFERFVPLGRGREIADQVLTARQWRHAVEAVALAADLGEVELEELLPFRAFWLELAAEDGELRGARCNLGDEAMALMPDGTVYPCRRLPIAVGRLPEEPFGEILGRLARWAVPALKAQLSGALCRGCAVPGCAGCRALAFALTGDPLSDDVQCFAGG